MLKKEITYTTFDDEEITEQFLFNISKAELYDMELGNEKGLEETIREIVKTQDRVRMWELFKGLIVKSYGVKSPDGKRFIKSEELTKEFTQTDAFSVLMTELLSNEQNAIAFVNGIIPKDLAEQVNAKA